MYSKQQIIDTLNSEDIFIDNFILEAFIKNWRIEPIYEDAQGVEFFDDMAIEKIKNGIKQKQPKYEVNIIDKDEITPVDISVEISENPVEETPEQTEETCEPQAETTETHEDVTTCEVITGEITEAPPLQEPVESELPVSTLPVSILNEVNKEVENELKNVTLDISNQTLAVLAESIARKITCDVADFIKKTDFIEEAVQLGEYKKDNQILVEKIDELIADNRTLIKKIEELDKENKSFVKLFGNVYMKNR